MILLSMLFARCGDTLDKLGTFCMWFTSKFSVTFQISKNGLWSGQFFFFFFVIYIFTSMEFGQVHRVTAAKNTITE